MQPANTIPADISLANPADEPTDTISSIAWSSNPAEKVFACSSWDSQIHIFDVSTTHSSLTSRVKLATEHPCLSVCWGDDMNRLFAGSIDGSLRAFDIIGNQSIDIGQHDGVKDLHWMAAARTLCSLGYDKKIRFWDLRQKKPAGEFDLGEKAFCSSLVFPMLGVGLSGGKMLLINLPSIQKMMSSVQLNYIQSSLGPEEQLTCLELSYDGKMIIVGSANGRANISTIENDVTGAKLRNIMTFKCHKTDDPVGHRQTLFPVHGAGFHPVSEKFVYTAGGEGSLFFWDFIVKNKIKEFKYSPLPITKAKVSPDGSLIAYGLGYDWAKGIVGDQSHRASVRAHAIEEAELSYQVR